MHISIIKQQYKQHHYSTLFSVVIEFESELSDNDTENKAGSSILFLFPIDGMMTLLLFFPSYADHDHHHHHYCDFQHHYHRSSIIPIASNLLYIRDSTLILNLCTVGGKQSPVCAHERTHPVYYFHTRNIIISISSVSQN